MTNLDTGYVDTKPAWVLWSDPRPVDASGDGFASRRTTGHNMFDPESTISQGELDAGLTFMNSVVLVPRDVAMDQVKPGDCRRVRKVTIEVGWTNNEGRVWSQVTLPDGTRFPMEGDEEHVARRARFITARYYAHLDARERFGPDVELTVFDEKEWLR
jgi:hypothetical protein